LKIDFSELDRFVAKGVNGFGARAYLDIEGFNALYMRIAHHRVDGSLVKTLDISSIEVEEGLRGRGIFKLLVNHCEKLCMQHGLSLYVECVHNDQLERHLVSAGFSSDGLDIGPSFSLSLSSIKAKHDKDPDYSF
jgi:GNAT superfamily N-acetyltransferase